MRIGPTSRRWEAIWHRITQPAEQIRSEEQRQQASLLAGLSAALLIAGGIALTLWVLTAPDFPTTPYLSTAIMCAIGLAYGLSRTRYYLFGAFILVVMLILMVEAIILVAPGPMTLRMLALNFLVVAILLTSLFFSVRSTLLVAAICIIRTVFFFAVPSVLFNTTYSYVVFIAVMSALLIVAAVIRNTYIHARRTAEKSLLQSEARYRQTNEQLQIQMAELRHLEQQLREESIRDPLTLLYNRRYLTETLTREIARAAREEYGVGILMIDLDHFKQVNDIYGHAVGDEVLQRVAALIKASQRAGDIACRYGGEELLCVLIDMEPALLMRHAEELRAAIADCQVSESHPSICITASIGVSRFPEDGASGDLVIRAADQALYQAKAAGRNCVRLARPAAAAKL
jgi:diguanylate cyclase (GGDEF)-like protein